MLAPMIHGAIAGYATADIIPSERVITWAGNVGVSGGVPERSTICATATAGASASAINSLISSCPAGQVVYLPAGTYNLSSSINITKGITLRGAGPNSTILNSQVSSGYAIDINNNGNIGSGVNVTSGYTKGSTSLTLSSTSGIGVGTLLWVDQLNDGSLVSSKGLGGSCTWCGRDSGTRSMAQITKVTSVSGNVVTISPAMQYSYSSSLSPQAARITNVIDGAGVESLKIFDGAGNGTGNIYIRSTQNSWVKNVNSERAHSGGSASCYHIRMEYSFRGEIRDSYFHGNTQTASNSYVIQVVYGSTGILLENNIFNDAKSYIYAGWGASGNVAGYNYIHGFQNDMGYYSGDISGHGAYPKFFLLEGNYGQKFRWDNYWGYSGYNTGFRNYYRATQPSGEQSISSYRTPVDVDYGNRYFNVVGNVLGSPGASWGYQVNGGSCSSGSANIYVLGFGGEGCAGSHDSQVFTTMLRHGNFDYSTGTTKWCNDSGETGCQGGDGSHAIPNSLYLAGKPSWWCKETPWPPIGPDLSPMVSDIPAKRRFEGLACTASGSSSSGPSGAFALPLPPGEISIQ